MYANHVLCATLLVAIALSLSFTDGKSHEGLQRHHVRLKFLRYEPCAWEKKWIANVGTWGPYSGNQFCDLINEPSEKTNTADVLAGIKQMMQDGNSTSLPETPRNREIFSRFIYEETNAKGQVSIVERLIEPLAQLIRYYGVCIHQSSDLLRRDYLVFDADPLGEKLQKFYLDLGASTWDSGAGGLSSKWFFEEYQRRGLKIDRALLWEVGITEPNKLFGQVPQKYFHAYQYFNIPAEPTPGNLKNPFEILKTIVHKHDFVALKIDIDTPSIENQLTAQLVKEIDVLAPLIDEFFYEQHVRSPTMMQLGWGDGVSGTLEDTYKLHVLLRSKGIRSHGWP